METAIVMNVSLESIRIDGGTQPRAKIDTDTVAEYAEHYRNKVDLPELVVYFDGKEHWLADGFHRYHGAREAGRTTIACAVLKGTQRDAILYSCGANDKHGLKRTAADKHHAVDTVLQDEEWRQKSDNWVAEKCRVSRDLVADRRKKLESTCGSASGRTGETRRTGKDGRTRRTSSAARSESQRKRHEAKAAEPEADPAPEPELKDKDGKPIPKHLQPHFERAKDFEALCKACDEISAGVRKLCAESIGIHLHEQSIAADLNNAKSAIRFAKPYAVCPYCNGGGKYKGKTCGSCRGVGFVGRSKLKSAPAEMRA